MTAPDINDPEPPHLSVEERAHALTAHPHSVRYNEEFEALVNYSGTRGTGREQETRAFIKRRWYVAAAEAVSTKVHPALMNSQTFAVAREKWNAYCKVAFRQPGWPLANNDRRFTPAVIQFECRMDRMAEYAGVLGTEWEYGFRSKAANEWNKLFDAASNWSSPEKIPSMYFEPLLDRWEAAVMEILRKEQGAGGK